MESVAENGDPGEWPQGANLGSSYEYNTRIESNHVSQFPISAVCFDPFEELVWTGNLNGRVSSFCASNNFDRYTSFPSVIDDVRALEAGEHSIFALSANSLKANTKQGLFQFHHSTHHMVNLCSMFRLQSAPTLLLGGDQPTMIQFDLEKQRELRVARITEKNVTNIRASGNHIFTSDSDGNFAMRSISTLETIRMIPKAHGGPINDFDVCGNTLISCGSCFRVNALHGDPYVKIYDLRMFNALQPLALSFAPSFTRFIDPFYGSRVIFCSEMGQAHITDINERGPGTAMLIESDGQYISSFATSGTKQLLAFGDEIGSLHIYSDRAQPTVNDRSFNTELIGAPGGLPQSFNIDDSQTSLASVPLPYSTDEGLLSDWPEDLCIPVYRRQKPLSGAPIIKSLQYVSYTLNPKAGTPFSRFNTVPYYLDEVETPVVEEILDDRPLVIPQFYRSIKHLRQLTKRGGKIDTALAAVLKCNKSQVVPLECASPLAGAVNPVVYMLYSVPALRNIFLMHICEKEHCIACQLGFLFRMITDRCPKTSCSSVNLVRSLTAPEDSPLHRNPIVQEALDYTIGCVDKALTGEEGMALDAKVAIDQYVNLRCVRCSEVRAGEERRLVVTLQYPNESIPASENLTLCSLIEKSLHLRYSRDLECPACNTQTRFDVTRRVRKLPPILLVDANPSSDHYRSFWTEQLRLTERRPAYKEPEHEYSIGNVNRAEKTCRYGTECRNRPYCKYSHGSGDWETECETWLSDTGGRWKHFVNKSFTAKVSNGISILKEESTETDVDTYELIGMVVEICYQIKDKLERHFVTLMKTQNEGNLTWVSINDILITQIHEEEALHMDHRWKLPVTFVYASKRGEVMSVEEQRTAILASVFQTDRNLTGNDEFQMERSLYSIPEKGDLIALDAEFINLGKDQPTVARVSCVDAERDIVLIDDYVKTCDGHVVDDYLTQYSGIIQDDLDPSKSTKHLTTLKNVYLKLLHLVEKGVIFVGHGLQSDFSVLNIYVPQEQIRDTVLLFHLPKHRYISLQFLAWYLLNEKIQENSHDSVVDARVALKLYRKYLDLEKSEKLVSTIAYLYETGQSINWRIGDSPPTKSPSPLSSSTES